MQIKGPKMKEYLKKTDMGKLKEKINEEKGLGRFLQARWQESELIKSGCFAWLPDWTCAPMPIPLLREWSCTSSSLPVRCTQSTQH